MLKKKFVNFRPLFYIFITLATAIVLSRYILASNFVYLGVTVALLFSFVAICILKKNFKVLFVIILSFILGFSLYLIEISKFANTENAIDVIITARVSNKISENNSYQTIIFDDVKTEDGRTLSNVIGYNYNKNNKFLPGEVVKGKVSLRKFSPFKAYSFSSNAYRNNVYYSFTARKSNFEILSEDNLHFDENIQISVKEKLNKFMTEENSNISYAMLFGDKSEVNDEIRNSFSDSGIAHILAVSGLHVGVLVSVLYFILKKCKVNKFVIPAVIFAILLIYCILCSFSPSVVRASIMAIVLLLSKTFSKEYDSLSSIGLAGIIILLVKPLSIFDIGFQMSFASVIAIAVFYKTIFNFLRKIKLPKFIASPLSVSICVQIGLFPLLINCFNKISILSVFLNLLIIPIFSFAFIVLLFTLPLLYISSFFGNILFAVQFILEIIKLSAQTVANIPYTFITLFGLNFAFYFGYYSTLFVSSRFMLVSKKSKLIACLSAILLTVFCCGFIFAI